VRSSSSVAAPGVLQESRDGGPSSTVVDTVLASDMSGVEQHEVYASLAPVSRTAASQSLVAHDGSGGAEEGDEPPAARDLSPPARGWAAQACGTRLADPGRRSADGSRSKPSTDPAVCGVAKRSAVCGLEAATLLALLSSWIAYKSREAKD